MEARSRIGFTGAIRKQAFLVNERIGCGFANDSFLAHDCPSLYRLFTLPVHVDSIPEGKERRHKMRSMLNCRKIYNMTPYKRYAMSGWVSIQCEQM